jgi:hypothetical protein
MNHLLLLILLTLVVYPSSCGFSYDEFQGWPDESNSALRGSITDAAGGAISGAALELKDLRGNARTTMTDKAGRYRFNGLDEGTYVLSIAQPDFDPLQEKVKVGKGQTRELNLVLYVSTASYQ